MVNSSLILFGKGLSKTIHSLNLGNGSTWPGHIALQLNRNFIQDILHKSSTKVIFVAGTNGKTTTTSMLAHILRAQGKTVIQNTSGANLLNGIASTLLLHANATGRLNADYALFEIDENAFPKACKIISPDIVILLNLFRDQLDRYGEVNSIALKWQEALSQLPETTTLLINADDPQIAFLGAKAKQQVSYFGGSTDTGDTATPEHAADSLYCPNCGEKLKFSHIFYSHLGIWSCPGCKRHIPETVLREASFYPLQGAYNAYNTHSAILAAQLLNIPEKAVAGALQSFKPAFGRQETVSYEGRNIEVILAKNPTGFNEALRTIQNLNAKTVLLVLNDNIADGTDVSWIWDIDFETLLAKDTNIVISGTRAFDMGVRLKYSQDQRSKVTDHIETDTKLAIKQALKVTDKNETLYILPTYTAMLEIRKIITGKKIL